jgi:hypothetical protein
MSLWTAMIYSRALKANFGNSILNLFGKQPSRQGAQLPAAFMLSIA